MRTKPKRQSPSLPSRREFFCDEATKPMRRWPPTLLVDRDRSAVNKYIDQRAPETRPGSDRSPA